MHHSPSSAKTGTACERRWWYEYREKRRAPEVTWAQVIAWGDAWQEHCTPNQRTLARGTATHAVLEEYYEGGAPDWSTVPGELALRMRAHLPSREACLAVRIEQSVGPTPYPRPAGERGADDPGEPDRTALMWPDESAALVRWLGYVDLAAQIDPTGAEAKRLFPGARERAVLCACDGWATYDYKTSKNVNRYAITPAQALAGDDGGQGVLYAYDGAYRARRAPKYLMRWVYAQTEGARIARPVDVVFARDACERVLTRLSEGARNREAITCVDEAIPNADACAEYGGCPHHHSRGGPCSAVRSIGSLIQMGFKDQYLKGQAAGGAGAPADTNAAPPPAETNATTTSAETNAAAGQGDPPTDANTAPPANTKPTPPRTKATTKAAHTGSLAALAEALAESEACALAAQVKLDAAKEAMRKALG